jgi:uncharacterized protein YegP (UPF0339 family)
VSRFQCYRTDESRVRWRLLGGNNRVLGMGLLSHSDFDAAVVDIDWVRQAVAGAVFDVERADTGLWWWRMQGRQGRVASSAQGFARRVDATLAAARFRTRAPAAGIVRVVAVFQSGRRGRVARENGQEPPEGGAGRGVPPIRVR